MTTPSTPDPGWYPDPNTGNLRYWDGSQWTEHVSGHQPYPATGDQQAAPQQNTGNTLSIIGIVCGGLAVIIFPILLGPAGLILGGIGLKKGEKLAPIAMIVGGVGLVLGMVLGALLAPS